MIARSIGNYIIEQKLGEGGMGVVYLGVHPRIGRKVAVKTLRAGHSAEEVSRFFVEAKACADLRNPHIVDIYDFGEDEVLGSYIIMEFLEGQTLRDTLKAGAGLPPDRAVHIARGIVAALSAAHARNIVHRDLKPDNIFLIEREGERDFVKVLDFGVAKLISDDDAVSSTKTGTLLGTPAYMSPEQCNGGTIDPRTDIYALGVILFHMLTGRLPYSGQAMAQMHAHVYEAPPSLRAISPTVPAWLEALTLKAMQKAPADRFQTMQEVLAALAQDNAASTTAPLAMEQAMSATANAVDSAARAVDLANLDTLPVAAFDKTLAAESTLPPRRRTALVIGIVLALAAAAGAIAIGKHFKLATHAIVAPASTNAAPEKPPAPKTEPAPTAKHDDESAKPKRSKPKVYTPD